MISICIPTYEMHGQGAKFLRRSFDAILTQTYRDFEVVVSDHSKNHDIFKVCKDYAEFMDLRYYHNRYNVGSSSANLNTAMRKARGELIKILFQDDSLHGEYALQKIVGGFDYTNGWLVTACNRAYNSRGDICAPFYPDMQCHLRKNTMGPPSCLTVKNEGHLEFDESMVWMMDCDYIWRCWQEFGKPGAIMTPLVTVGIGEHQVSNTIANRWIRVKENAMMMWKHRRLV